jgi:cellulose synthase/poly-beta-1,6-N-acetylglucosamine synthase-like glycosyltransferase
MINFALFYLSEILLAVFGISVLLLILYYLILFFRFATHKQKPLESLNLPISIVMVAKNDAHHLIRTLPELLSQDYPQFEVVVVNDNSNDETQQVIIDFQNRFPNLRMVNLESSVTNIKGKKFPLSLGIKAANYEHVLLTDTDCLPASNQWINRMARHFSNKTKMVLGFSRIRKRIGFANLLLRFDILHQAIKYFSCCLAKIPYMGVGQNLAYSKTLFFNHKGFAAQNHLLFGDDDLFVNKVATAYNCAIEYAPEAHTISHVKANFSNWFLHKTFRSKTRKLYYQPKRFLINFYNFLTTFTYIALGFAIWFALNNLIYLSIIFGILLVKYIIQFICFGVAAKKLNEKRLIPHILFFDIVFAILNPVIYLVSKFKK